MEHTPCEGRVTAVRIAGEKDSPEKSKPKVWADDVLCSLFADEYTTEAAYMRWRTRGGGAVTFRSVLNRLWALLMHGTVSMTVVRSAVFTHVHDGFEMDMKDMSNRTRRLFVALLEQGKEDPDAYTCATESFVQHAIFLNFAQSPTPKVAYSPLELFARCIDYDVAQASDVVTVQLAVDTLSHFASSMVCTQKDLTDEQRKFLLWLNEHCAQVFVTVANSPEFVIGLKGVIHNAWANWHAKQ